MRREPLKIKYIRFKWWMWNLLYDTFPYEIRIPLPFNDFFCWVADKFFTSSVEELDLLDRLDNQSNHEI